jgi:hypothetical protein
LTPVTLEVGQTLAIDVTLDIAKQTEAVDVVATPPLVESQSSNITQTVTREMLAALPLPNRAASSLASGVVPLFEAKPRSQDGGRVALRRQSRDFP